MRRFATCLTLLSVLPLAAGCPTMASVSDGAGYARLTPNSATRTFITQNDPVFTGQVAEHNIQCDKDEGCQK